MDGPALAYPLLGISMAAVAVFQSLGFPGKALTMTLGGIVLVKLPVLLLSARVLGLTGIWVSEAVSELLLCVVALGMLKQSRSRGVPPLHQV